MKKKDIRELHNKTKKELEELIKTTQEELLKLKIDLGAGRVKNSQAVNQKRHDLARLKAILKEKELTQ